MAEPILTVPTIGFSAVAGSAHFDVSAVHPAAAAGCVAAVVPAVDAAVVALAAVLWLAGAVVPPVVPDGEVLAELPPPPQATRANAAVAPNAQKLLRRFVTSFPHHYLASLIWHHRFAHGFGSLIGS
jgi:hypothetical protein